MLLKSQLVRSTSKKRSKVTRFCSVLYVQAGENENENENESERERESCTKSLSSNRMQMSTVEGQVYAYNLISGPTSAALSSYRNGYHFSLSLSRGWTLAGARPTFRSDKTYYAIAQLSQQIADRFQLMSKTRRTDFAVSSLGRPKEQGTVFSWPSCNRLIRPDPTRCVYYIVNSRVASDNEEPKIPRTSCARYIRSQRLSSGCSSYELCIVESSGIMRRARTPFNSKTGLDRRWTGSGDDREVRSSRMKMAVFGQTGKDNSLRWLRGNILLANGRQGSEARFRKCSWGKW